MYFDRIPQSESKPVDIQYEYGGFQLVFETDSGVFSRGEMDQGTDLLLEALAETPITGRVLDLGCGWGAIGISIAKSKKDAEITMVDVNLRAVELSRKNAQRNKVTARVLESDGLQALSGEMFDCIVTNPPIRTGKQKVYELLQSASLALRQNGRLFLVIRKQQGAESCIRFLGTLFSSVEKIKRSAGFWVICAEGVKNHGTDIF